MATIKGNDGNDKLTGTAGADTFLPKLGTDTVDGGAGKDYLNGGAGADKTVFGPGEAAATRADADTIVGFSHLEGEKIDVSLIDANNTGGGNQAFSFIGSAAFTAAGQLHVVQDSAALNWLEGDTHGDHVADLVIQTGLSLGASALVAGDFVL